MSTVRIAANDPTLAHALTRGAVRAQNARHVAAIEARLADCRNVRQLGRMLRQVFGPRLIDERVPRRDGSRAHGVWLMLAGDGTGGIAAVLDLRALRIARPATAGARASKQSSSSSA